MSFLLGELARRFGGEVRGDASVTLRAVAPLHRAGPGELAYVADTGYDDQLRTTRASAVILPRAMEYSGNAWLSDNPRLCFAHAAQLLHPPESAAAGTHETASVHPDADIAPDAHVGPLCVIEAGTKIAAGAFIGPGCFIGKRAEIGAHTRLAAHVSIHADCTIGTRCIIDTGAVIGSDGFGYAKDGARWIKVPQLGRVVVGDDVEIGANTTIDRGALDDTVIGNGVKLDNLIQVGHNVYIGDDTAMAACVGIAGSAIIGKRCTVGGQAGIAGHLSVGDDVHILARTMVSHTITQPGAYSSALPAQSAQEWRRNAARLRHLDELARRVKALEQQIQHVLQGKKS